VFRRTGWNELGEKGFALISEKFIPYAPFWGGHGYSNVDAWWGKTYGDHRFMEGAFEGTPWFMHTSEGTMIKGTAWGQKGLVAGLEDVLKAYRALPENKRRAVVGDRGTADPEWKAASTFPPGGLALNVWTRPLKRDGKGGFLPQIEELIGHGAPPEAEREFGANDGFAIHGYSSPQRDTLWLTEAEWKSLVPANPEKGQSIDVPEPVRLRIFLLYLYNNSGMYGGFWAKSALRTGELKVTVEDVTPQAIRMRVDGSALLRMRAEDGHLDRGLQPKLPDKLDMGYDCRLYGRIHYDREKKAITRFDMAALGDFRGIWCRYYKAKPVPVAFAFELDARALPPERRPMMPFGMFATMINTSFTDVRDYWDPRK